MAAGEIWGPDMTGSDRRLIKGGPQQWVFALFVFFGAAQLIAGVVFFFAFNWRDLPDTAKIALPQIVMAAGFLGWALTGPRSRFGASAGVLATMMIGVAMGVVGQVYQLGADPWRLFAIWAALALPLAVIARNDGHFAVWFVIASVAYFLYADENLLTILPERHGGSLIIGFFTLSALGVLFLRESFAGGAPPWQRWLFAAAALGAALTGGVNDLFGGRTLFAEGFPASLSLAVTAAVLVVAYRTWRPDKPTQTLALFACAVWIAALGIRILTLGDIDSAYAASFVFFLSALWVIAVTAGFAILLRRITSSGRAGS